MQTWVWALGAATGLFVLTSVLKTAIGIAVRYLIFVLLAGVLFQAQRGGEVDFVSPEILSSLATIGALSFAFTLGVMAVLFRNSRFKVLLFPMVGFATTFAATAMVTQ